MNRVISIRSLVIGILAMILIGCSATSGLKFYSDPNGAFSFAYPNGMISTSLVAGKGPSLLFRDLVYDTENVNLILTPYDRVAKIEDLGTPKEVGARVADKILAPNGSGKTAQLLNAGQLQRNGKTYYILEYTTTVGTQKRHDVVSVTVNQNRLYTLNASTMETRWAKVKDQFYAVAQSLKVS